MQDHSPEKPKNVHEGHRRRLKARFLQSGLEGFEPHNVLELILFYCVPQKDTNELAHDLINRFGSLNQVLDAPYEELLKVKGVGENTASLLKLLLPVGRYYAKNVDTQTLTLDTPDKVGEYLLGCFTGLTEERVALLSLDDVCNPLSLDFVSEGDISSAGLRFRTLIETVLRTKASAVILCHNHPGGIALPSPEDIESTRQVRDVLRSVGVALVDHFILAQDDFVSLAQSAKYKALFRE